MSREAVGRLEDQLRRVLAVAAELAGARAADEVARIVIDHGVAAVGAASAALWLVEDGAIRLARGAGALAALAFGDDSPLAHVARSGESYERDAIALFPVVVDGSPIGVLGFAYDEAGAFEPNDRAFKAILARQCALALERARLLEDERTARREAELLYELTATVSSLDDLERVYAVALDTAVRGSASPRAAILVLDGDGVMQFKAWRGLSETYRQAITGHLPWRVDAAQFEPIVVDDIEATLAWRPFCTALRVEGIRALALVPLVHRRRLIGMLALYREEARPFAPREIQLTEAVAFHVAQAIERKRAERELARAYRVEHDARIAAEEATRAREEILSVVSHDLRSPLGAVMLGASTLLALDLGDKTSRVRPIAERVHRQAERMARLIGDLVDFAGIQAGRVALEVRRHAPADLIAAACELFGPVAEERGLLLEARAPTHLPPIACDSDRAVQVISNLVANALKVTPRGGKIAVGAELSPGEELVFFVRDTGPGIDPAELPRLFERFWRSSRSTYKGAGLGLSIARGLVDAHGGRIWAESRPGHGSTFYFSFAGSPHN